MVLIMTVNPGFGGQLFIKESYNKISELHKMIDAGGYNVLIEVDGGIDTLNAAKLIQSGVNVLVAGSSVFSSSDPDRDNLEIEKTKLNPWPVVSGDPGHLDKTKSAFACTAICGR